MPPVRMYIADADVGHIDMIVHYVERSGKIRIVGRALDGNQALRDIGMYRPDVLLMDIQLPGLDGLTLLKELQRLQNRPVTIVCTRFYSDIIVTKACYLGAFHFLYKPIDYNRIVEIIWDCWAASRQAARRRDTCAASGDRVLPQARRLISDLGIPANHNGFLYAMEALACLQSDPTLMKNLSKGLYVSVAHSLKATPHGVERSLRNAIACAYLRGTALREVFPARPTNSSFLKYLYDRIQSGDGSPPKGPRQMQGDADWPYNGGQSGLYSSAFIEDDRLPGRG